MRDQQLAAVLAAAAAGDFPAADGGVTVLPAPSPRDSGVLGFTAHAVVFADADPAWVAAQLPAGDLAAPLSPAFLQALCQHTGREMHTIDMLCTATTRPGPPPLALAAEPDRSHPRIARAMRYRDDVRAWRADGGVVLLGRGIAGRWEASVEVDRGPPRPRAGPRRWPPRPATWRRPAPRSGRRSHRPTRPACGPSWRPASPRSARKRTSSRPNSDRFYAERQLPPTARFSQRGR